MDVFNPKILDACIRDVATCLSDNQKADLILYAMGSLKYEGCVGITCISPPRCSYLDHSRSRTVIENAVQSCLQISTLSPENAAKARILRARARLNAGSLFGAQEGTWLVYNLRHLLTHNDECRPSSSVGRRT